MKKDFYQANSLYRGHNLHVCECPAGNDNYRFGQECGRLVRFSIGSQFPPSIFGKHLNLLPLHSTTTIG